ncbi:hypothetical protein [Azospirillum doebereinerae]|uniref:Type IV / VI secretion system DotU domain-containing protein n=1 Tax=Azospirillum doebereinerae TaxID=92933 RepID=A0A3S0V485_9PROT|nr:hypothetical protein [Azospirillum doebereinerae]MCG5240581.1 hypothetical protein [Azospirillum doebereinerae]RUQ66755.1 hypothetical protein EJ913_21430 [Azospirillum doebereinerae]
MTAVATVAARSTAQPSAQPSAMVAFRRFHAELLACCAPGQPVDAPPASDRLIAALHALTEAAVPLGPAAHGTTVKAAFAMAMLADRALSGARPGEAVVASRLFGANATMKTLFVQADDLIRQGSKGDRDLAAVYLAVLSLGFAEDPEAGARRTSLHGVVVGERTQGDRVSPRAYDPPAGAVMGPEQPSSRRWWWALGGAVAAFLLVSHLLWADAVGGIDRDLRGARAAIEDMGMSWSY